MKNRNWNMTFFQLKMKHYFELSTYLPIRKNNLNSFDYFA